ncbi:MAG: TIM barrel protein, partial [Rhodothermales bacterium]
MRTRMKLGISTWVWVSPATTEKLETLLPHIAEMGYDAVELPVEAPGDFDVSRARNLADGHGLDLSICAVIGPGRDLLLPEESDRGIAYLQACLETADAAGSPTLVGPLYSAVGRCWRSTPEERELDVARLVDILRALGERAATYGITLGIEPLNRYETSFLNTTAQAIELVDRVDHPSVGLSLDLFHAGIEEKNPADALRDAGKRLVHVQLAENDRGTPGTGHLPWSDIAAAL